jgi:hypothetical protein
MTTLHVEECDLCAADEITRRYGSTPSGWAADCKQCDTPMVVLTDHGRMPTDDELVTLLTLLDDATVERSTSTRWIVDAQRRTIRDHWHAHARPIDVDPGGWHELRPRLRQVAGLGARPDARHGWRCWTLDDDGMLVSQERGVPWPERRHVAVCDSARSAWPQLRGPAPCKEPPGAECLCGVAYFAALADAAELYGSPAAPFGRNVWAAITTEGTVRRDHALLGATWRCAASELVALVVGPNLVADTLTSLRDRYGVPVVVAENDTAAAFLAAARAHDLPAVDRPGIDPREELAGGAWSTNGVPGLAVAFGADARGSFTAQLERRPGVLISWVPGRSALPTVPGGQRVRRASAVPGARFTWFEPGRHRLAFTADECDRILDAVDLDVANDYGRTVGLIRSDGAGEWVWERLGEIVRSANAAWWNFTLADLRNVGVSTHEPGTDLAWHTDATPIDQSYRLSLAVMLTEASEYAGGRWQAMHDERPTAPPTVERGSVYVYPSTLLHRVTKIESGRRQSLIGFAHGPLT